MEENQKLPFDMSVNNSKKFVKNFNVLVFPQVAKFTGNRDFSWKWPVFCHSI